MSRSEVDPSVRPPYVRSQPHPGSSDILLALRLMALAVVSVSAALAPSTGPHLGIVTAGVVTSATLAALQVLALRRDRRAAACLATAAQLVLATVLTRATGGLHSPLTALYLFEVPLSGIALGPLGVTLATAGGVAAVAVLGRGDGSWSGPAALVGFIGVAAGVTGWMLAVDRRRRRELETTHAALRRRADDLADELRLLGDYMSGGLVTVDTLGRVTRMNHAGCELLGIGAGDAPGRAWQDVLRPAGGEAADLATALLEPREARDLRLVLERSCGTRVAVCADVFPSRTRADAEVYVLLDPLPEAAAGDPLRSLGEAATNVSHQIRNSLHSLQGLTARLASRSPAAEDDATDLARALGALGELAEDVLAMSGAAQAEETLELTTVLATATVLARRNDVPIVVHARRDADVLVRAHRGRLVHALFNLLDNACRVTRCGGIVEVTLGARAGDAWVEICDRGPGPAALDARGRHARRPNGGIGLPAARRFVEGCGGRIEFLAREGGGSRCRVHLRRVAADDLVRQA